MLIQLCNILNVKSCVHRGHLGLVDPIQQYAHTAGIVNGQPTSRTY